ncbi:MAG: acetylesterase, partial [Phycisphaeraceae bacterium]|nr:acetylesterase [Phycisphaeraceae bacterium]
PQAKPDSYRNWDATGAMLLAYAQPLGRIHLTGRTPSTAPEVDRRTAEDLVADGRDWGSRTRLESWSDRSNRQLLRNLESWSPVVRERAAIELARRDGDPTASLRKMLRRDDPYARLGACQAAIMLKERAAPLVDELRVTLESDDLWTRAKAAEAIAAIGGPAMPALPDLLAMLAEPADASDPRRMEQRYLCFALFDRRDGMLGRSLEGVDRDDLLAAVAAGLRNEDGRARGAVRSVYQNLSFEAITPLLPAIHEAMIEPAPSGIMFADEIRLAGLDLFAEHGIEEGVPWCVTMIDPERWGMGNRIERSLNALRVYGGAARGQIPRLKALQAELEARKWNPERLRKIDIPGRIREIENDDAPRTLRRIDELTPGRAG